MHRTNSLKTLQDEIWKRTKHAQAISEEEQSNHNSSNSNIILNNNNNDSSFSSYSHQQSRSNFTSFPAATSSIASLSKIIIKPSANDSSSKPSMSCLPQRKLLSMMRINSRVNKLGSAASNSSFSKLNSSVDGGSTILDSQQLSNQPDNYFDSAKGTAAVQQERSRSHLFSISEEPEKEKRKKANIQRVMKDISKRLKTHAKDKENSFFNRYIKEYEHCDTYFNVKSVFASINDSMTYLSRNKSDQSTTPEAAGRQSSNQKDKIIHSNRDDSGINLSDVTSWLRKLKESSLGNDDEFDKGGEESSVTFDEIKEPTDRKEKVEELDEDRRRRSTKKLSLKEANNTNKVCRNSKSHDYSGSSSTKNSNVTAYFSRDSRKTKSIMFGSEQFKDSSSNGHKHIELSQISTNPMMMTQFNKQNSSSFSRRSDSSTNSFNEGILLSRKNTRVRQESVHSSSSNNTFKMRNSDSKYDNGGENESIKTKVDQLMDGLSHATESYGRNRSQEGGQNEEESEMDGFYRNLAQELIKETDSLANNAQISSTQNERIKKEIHSINALIHKVSKQQSQLHEDEQTESIPTAKQQYLMFRQKSDQVIKLIRRGGYSILKSKMLSKTESQQKQLSSVNDSKSNQDTFKQTYGRRSTLVQMDEPIERIQEPIALPEIAKKDKRQLSTEDNKNMKQRNQPFIQKQQQVLKYSQSQVTSGAMGNQRIGGLLRDPEQKKDSNNQSIYLTECQDAAEQNQAKQMHVRIQPLRPYKSLSQDLRKLPSFSGYSHNSSSYQGRCNSKDTEEERSTTQGSPNAATPASPYEQCLFNNFSNVTSPNPVGLFTLDASPVIAAAASMDKPRLRIINSIFRKSNEPIGKKISNNVAEENETVTVKRRTSSIDRFKKEVEEEHKMREAQFQEAKRNIASQQAGQIKNIDNKNEETKSTSNHNKTANTGNCNVPLSKIKMPSTNSPLLQMSKDLKYSSFHQQQYSVKVQRVLYQCDMEEIEMEQLKAAFEESKQFQDKRFKALSHHQSSAVLPGLKDILSRTGEK